MYSSITSAIGVNHLRWYLGTGSSWFPSKEGGGMGFKKADAGALNSLATDCIHPSPLSSSNMHTAAGFPLNGVSVKAST